MSTALSLPPDEATIAGYLANQLTQAQAEAFEIYCLDHPEFARKVELDLCMKRGLREIGKNERSARTVFRRPQTWAIAAGLGAVLVCGLLLLAWPNWHGSPMAYRSLAEVPLELRTGAHLDVTLLRLRGPDTTHRVVSPGRSGVLALKLLPDSAPGPEGYSVSLALGSIVGSRSVVLDHLRGDAHGFLEVYLPLSEAAGHTLKITLASEADRSAATTTTFQLQVVARTD